MRGSLRVDWPSAHKTRKANPVGLDGEWTANCGERWSTLPYSSTVLLPINMAWSNPRKNFTRCEMASTVHGSDPPSGMGMASFPTASVIARKPKEGANTVAVQSESQ
eukprot:1190130-Prorocentrum_minimum.AAC.1